MLQTKNQSKVSISGLTYNNLIEDAYNALKDSDAFKNNFTSFTSNSAERMITELYAYIATQVANRMDQMGNELFVDTASISGLSRLLKLVGAKVDFPASAETEVTVTTPSNSNEIVFSYGIDGDTTLNFTTNSFKSVTANNGTNWEFIDRKVGEDGKYVYDYTTEFTFTPNTQKYKLYEGTTRSLIYTVNSINTDIITLNSTPVVRDSVRIYYKNKVLKPGTTSTYEIKEFKKVDNFFTTEALTAKTGVFTEKNVGNGRCEIWLKPYYDEATNASDIGKDLLIMYRIGSGSNGNISPGAINKTEQFNIISNGRVTGHGQINIKNTVAGNGGVNELTTDEIRATVMQEVRNTKIAVTEEDYEYLFPKYDSDIALIKCYGEKDDESADLSETYGYYVNPLYVWLLILKSSTELNDLYMSNSSTILTDIINDIQLSTFDINPRFDEVYQIKKASLNNLFKKDSLKNYLTEATNTYSFPVSEEGVETLLAGGCQITVTNNPYIESSQESKKGVHCFDRYSSAVLGYKTWGELEALASATKDDVYIVTDSDLYDEINNRWICIQTYSGVTITDPNVTTYWKKVDFEYIYDNLVTSGAGSAEAADRLYIEESGTPSDLSFSTVYSTIKDAFNLSWDKFTSSQCWEDDHLIFPSGTTLIINGDAINIGERNFVSAQELCDFINQSMSPSTNMVILKENIPSADPSNNSITSKSGYTPGTAGIVLNDGTTTNTIEVTTTGVSTYGGLITAINSALSSASLSNKYKAISYYSSSTECSNVAIISAHSFTYNDRATDGTSAIYSYLLNNDPNNLPLSSFTYAIEGGNENSEPWGSNFVDAAVTIAYLDENGNICFGFDDEGKCSVNVNGRSDVRDLFGLSSTDVNGKDVVDKRIISVVLSIGGTSNSATVNVQTTSNTDVLDSDIYINIFGAANDDIKLGSYYEAENMAKVYSDETIRNLLTRDPIKNLYSTSYITTGNETTLDKYGANYQLKFSTGPVGELTFNQLSSESSPATITTIKGANDTMSSHLSGEYLYVKVDSIDFQSPGTITVEGKNVTVEESNGYAKFNLYSFNSWTIFEFTQAIVEAFKTTGVGSTPLLKNKINNNKVVVYTTSSAYYSSIDFGNTSQTLLYELFGLNNSVVHSPEGQIDAKQIKYKYFSLKNSVAVGRSLSIGVNGGALESINIGYSIDDFKNNIANSSVGDDVVLDNNRIILKSLEDGDSITVQIAWSSLLEYEAFEDMFSAETWEAFEPPETPTETGTLTCTYTNDGDYYIDLDENGNYIFKIQNPSSYPYGDIYFHMYEDYTNDHIVKDDEGIVYTDEYNWNSLMTDKRVMLTEHVYKQPRFVPFDLSITVYLPNNQQNSNVNYTEEIANFLRTEYGPFADTIGVEIVPEDIIFKIKEAFPQVRRVAINYIGYDITNQTTSKDSLETNFNQKHIIASTIQEQQLVSDPTSGILTSKLVTIKGLEIIIKYQA